MFPLRLPEFDPRQLECCFYATIVESSSTLRPWRRKVSIERSTCSPTTHTDQSTAKNRIISVRLLSMAMTGFFYTMRRPRTSSPMGALKYDPIGTSSSLSIDLKSQPPN